MKEHIRRVGRLTAIVLANVALLVALLVIIEGLSSYAFFLRELIPRLQESNLSHTEYDAEIGWVGLPNVDIKDMYGPGARLRTNRQGFRNAEDFAPKRDSDTRRIVCSGDSVTFGEHVGNDQTFCHLLAELDPKLETINMGQVGYGVDQAYLWYKRDADELDVDVHLFAFITHDFLRMQYDKFMGIPRPVVVLEDGKPVVSNVPISRTTYAMPPWLAETLNRADGLKTMELATAIRKKLNLAPRKVPGAWDARGAEEVKAVVAGMFEELRDYDSARSRATVLVYFPSVEELQQPNAELAYWMSVVEANARRLGIPFINFVSVFGELPAAEVTRLFVDGYHFSDEGNALVARELLRHLRDDPGTAGRSTAQRQTSDDHPTPPLAGTPYGHVVPSDVGHTVGVGVVAAVPTALYTGPNPITADNTLVENVVSTDCITVRANNVTFRNVIIDCDNWYGIEFDSGDNGLVEYSKIHNARDGKAISVRDGSNVRLKKNEITGGQDFIYFQGELDDIYVENNYMHSVVGNAEAHVDGISWWDSSNNGDFYIRGNYFEMNNPDIGVTDALFMTDPTAYVTFENNYVGVFGFYTLRCQGCGGAFLIQNNIYAQEFKTALPAPGTPTGAMLFDPLDPDLAAIYKCNRYEDGDFVEQRYIQGESPLTHDITGCPTYP